MRSGTPPAGGRLLARYNGDGTRAWLADGVTPHGDRGFIADAHYEGGGMFHIQLLPVVEE